MELLFRALSLPLRKAWIVFPDQLYAKAALASFERSPFAALSSVTLSVMKAPQPLEPLLPSYGIAHCPLIMRSNTNRGKACMPSPDYMLIRLCLLDSMPSRTAMHS